VLRLQATRIDLSRFDDACRQRRRTSAGEFEGFVRSDGERIEAVPRMRAQSTCAMAQDKAVLSQELIYSIGRQAPPAREMK